jgi:hypothetical protein
MERADPVGSGRVPRQETSMTERPSDDGEQGGANAQGNQGAIRDPDEWKTGDEPMTAAQRSYLHTLATEAGETLDDTGMTKAAAAKKIEELQRRTGRGQGPTRQ